MPLFNSRKKCIEEEDYLHDIYMHMPEQERKYE